MGEHPHDSFPSYNPQFTHARISHHTNSLSSLHYYQSPMAPTVLKIQPPLTNHTTNHPRIPKPPRVCFSFAAYAKAVIHHLATTSDVVVEPGLTEAEFTAIESAFHFTFPPDLRSVLQEGLPVGPGFPNWRCSSAQQLKILTSLPALGLCKEVATNNFWARSWGEKPKRTDEAVELAKRLLKESPVLVPIYRNCYIPCAPNLAGNPVFYVDGGDVRIWSFDIAGFFQQVDFGGNVMASVEDSAKPTDTQRGEIIIKNGKQERKTGLLPSCKRSATQVESGCMSPKARRLPRSLTAPAWAAREARRIEFWTEVVGGGGRAEEEARGETRQRQSGDLVGRMDDVWCRLRDGGWREEEVGEMMDGGEEGIKGLRDVVGHARELSVLLLRAGWSTEDVADSLGFQVENGGGCGGYEVESNWLEFRHDSSCCLLEAI